jgi:hypothetical protein
MIEALWFYLKLGFWHVIDKQGLDHLYFIVTLAIPFTFKQSKKIITVGYCIYYWSHHLFVWKSLFRN